MSWEQTMSAICMAKGAGVCLNPGMNPAVAISSWITNDVLADKGIGGVVITNHDNWEIFSRLARWAAGMENASR